MSNVKSQILAKVATLLDKFSDRLVCVARQTRQNTDAIATQRDEFRLKIGKADNCIEVLQEMIQDVKKENDEREAKQTLRDQSNVQSLVNLRDSTQKGFDAVKSDVENLIRTVQRLNERVGQADSKAETALSFISAKQPQSEMPSDHVWLNKKLTGVYDTTDDLETRVEKLENLIRLYEGLRLAQVALAEANGAFLAGPKV